MPPVSYAYASPGNSSPASTPQGSQGTGPPIFDLQGSINVLDPRNNSHAITRTMHYFRQHRGLIDCVVDAVVEQVCSYSTFKFSVLEKKKSVPWNASFLPLNAAKCVW